MRHIVIYLYQGISLSTQVQMEFYSSSEKPVNGSGLIHIFWSANSQINQKAPPFKKKISLVNTSVTITSRDSHTNWRVHPILKHILKVSQEAVFLRRDISCYEQTIGFKLPTDMKKG